MLLVCDSHPVQYRVPIYREMSRRNPESIHVVYASDCSVRGFHDAQFGRSIAWDDPMLEGYSHSILNCEKGEPLSSWGSLTGRGLSMQAGGKKPTAVLLTGLNYRFDWAALVSAKKAGLPLWLRCETQDEAAPRRSAAKEMARSLLYRAAYANFGRLFYIGELNRKHYLRHGVREGRLRAARYFTIDRFAAMDPADKALLRKSTRQEVGIPEDAVVVGFSGKFVPKKNPELLFQMLACLPKKVRSKVFLYFLGSGELGDELGQLAKEARQNYGVASHFAGFSNQSGLAKHYLAMDLLVLPSRRAGETWGLVANEAMQAGCGVAVSDAVGCGADFRGWERFRIFPEGSAEGLAKAVAELALHERSFSWAPDSLRSDYSLEATVAAFEKELAVA